MAKITNYPTSQPEAIPAEKTREINKNLKELYNLPKVTTNKELSDRIDYYFQFCEDKGIRPGVAQLALALGTTRQTFWNWSNGVGSDKERQSICLRARNFIDSFLENAFYQGAINPVSGIFLMKVWSGYRETISVEALPSSQYDAAKSSEEIAAEIENDIPLDVEPEPVGIIDSTEV